MSESRWRRASRRVIAETLAALPAGAGDAEKRRALRDAYPFVARKHLPYRMWCQEVSAALGTREQPRGRAEARLAFGEHDGQTVVVDCGHCHGKDCLLCLPLRQRLERRRATTDWLGWLRWLDVLRQDGADVTRHAFADWLTEQGWPEEAARVRPKGVAT